MLERLCYSFLSCREKIPWALPVLLPKALPARTSTGRLMRVIWTLALLNDPGFDF